MDKFQNRYRIQSARAPWWDYGSDGVYFITICTAHREYLFGEIHNGEMLLSPIGEIVFQEWSKSFTIRKELSCDAFVVMPNHLHAILRICSSANDIDGFRVEPHGRAALPAGSCGVAHRPVQSISSFVAGFKSAATKRINEYRNTPRLSVWQSRFHDHIIRSDKAYQTIMEYINSNPLHWNDDKLNLLNFPLNVDKKGC